MPKSLLAISLLAAPMALGSIQVIHPKQLKSDLRNDGFIKASLGNFGHIQYGSSTIGRVFYPVMNTDGCREFVLDDMEPDFYSRLDEDMLPIVMVDRGTCSFVQKVRNIEKLSNVKLSIIADNQEEESENLIMTDDGTGMTINIPSFIIRKRDAEIIKKVLNAPLNKQSVYIKA
jgi:hypothetical protein